MKIRSARFLAVLATAFLAAPAWADDCAKPDLLNAFPQFSEPPEPPPVIPNNATLTAHYAPTAQYLSDDEVLLEDSAGNQTAPLATFDSAQGLLQVTPAGLPPDEKFTIHWPRLAGIGTASRGKGGNVPFIVSRYADTAAPTFAGLDRLEWDIRRETDDCTGSLEDRFDFRIYPGIASDDFPNEFLALYIFQTEGPRVDPKTPPPPVSIQPFPEAGQDARVLLSVDDGGGQVCFAAFVMDLTGAPSGGAEHEVCAKTRKPPFFYGCSLAAPGVESPPMFSATLVLLVLSFVARRRHRP